MSEDIFTQVYEKKKELDAKREAREEMQAEREAWRKKIKEASSTPPAKSIGAEEVKKRVEGF